MNFFKMEPWAILPHPSTHTVGVGYLVVPKTTYLRPRKLHTMELGLMLESLPKNTLVKIENMLPTGKLLDTFWVATSHGLTLTLIAEHYSILYRGLPLCKIYLLPAECLVPGMIT